MTIYDVDTSISARDEARRLGRGTVIARLAGTLYRIDRRGVVRILPLEVAQDVEAKINDGTHSIVRLP